MGGSSNVFVESFERVDDDSKTLDLYFYEMKEWNGSGAFLKTNTGERRRVRMQKVASTIICPSVNDPLRVSNVFPDLDWSDNIVFKDELSQPTDKLSTNPMMKLTLHWGFIYHQDYELDLVDQYQQIFLLTVHPMITLAPSSILNELDL